MLMDESTYKKMYQQSIQDPQTFWGEQATRFITWMQPFQAVLTGDFTAHNVAWFTGGKLNAADNCLDKHLATRAEQTAIIWQGDHVDETRTLTYHELHTQVCKLANVLTRLGVKAGDRVCIYLPMIPEAAIAMLACARIGAVHAVVFAGFSGGSIENTYFSSRLCISDYG